MSEAQFLGARLDENTIKMVEDTAEEEDVDKTKALKELIVIGRKQFLITKNLESYRNGKCSLDKAAKTVGITVHEMMLEAAKSGIHSTETLDEYRQGVKLLMRLTN
jgi:predicted HTH domain antitoxin